MDSSLILPFLSRLVHIGTAVVLVGGTVFMRLVVIPSLTADSDELIGRIRNRWKRFVHGGILLFLISGFYNYFTMMPKHEGDGLYHALVGTKILLALFVFFLASVLVGRSTGTQKFRDQAGKWTGVLLVIAALIIGISSFVKVRPYEVRTDAEVHQSEID
ncbi:MAG: hypothetical protein R3C49_16690 [Planctomycetaceae bacterium]